jgi:UDP-N-acetyl-D-mannosaminuronic acid dehydrogenase
MAQVSVIGLGYMGLPMAALLAKARYTVVGVDINPATVASVNAGHCPFSEPGMAELVQTAHTSGRLRAVLQPEPAEIFMLSLPTPVDRTTHESDMGAVQAGARSIAAVLKVGDLVVLESTSPVGSTEKLVKPLIEEMRPDLLDKIDYVFCPERAIPGNTLHEMVHNDRLVGGLTKQATERGVALYQSFCQGQVLPTTAGVAEMVKLVENASRDAQIAFANELSLACAHLGLDVWEVIRLANHHPRVNILQPGAGVGGHCIAVDPWFIIHSAPHLTPLMRTVRQVNDGKPEWVVQVVRECVEQLHAQHQRPITVACLGLAYKPNVDDLRESPSLTVVDALMEAKPGQGAPMQVLVVEPHLRAGEGQEYPLTELNQAIEKSDVLVLLTAHTVFADVSAGALRGKLVVDPTGLWRSRSEPHVVLVPGLVSQY